MKKSEKQLYRVRFADTGEQKTVEVVAEHVYSSEFIGLVTIEGLVFNESKLVILPEEEAVRRRFAASDKLHIPYHSIIFVEQFRDDPDNLHQLPFMKALKPGEALKADAPFPPS